MIPKEIEKLLNTAQDYAYPDYLVAHEHETLISAGEITSRAARYYEKARYSVDYKEEHLLRRTAIERILRRRLTIDFIKEVSGLSFITELIQAGYLPNNELPERVLAPVEAVIHKTIFFTRLLKSLYPDNTHSDFRMLSIKLATSEIDELLFPATIAEATSKAFYKTIKDRISIIDSGKSREEQEVQIFLACRRGLFKDDDTRLFYKLWLLYYPEWTDLNHANEETDERLKQIAGEFDKVQMLIQWQLKSELHRRLIRKLKNDIIFFSIIQKIVSRDPKIAREIFNDPTHLSFVIRGIAEEEYRTISQKMQHIAWRAIIYIFITKTILALSVELPYDIFISKQIHYPALFINVVFHPLLLLAMTRSIANPGLSNTIAIEQGIEAIVSGSGHKEIVLRLQRRKSTALQIIAGLFYFALFIPTFGTILWFLIEKLHFNSIGTAFFVFFLTFVSYFGLRIRFIARQWVVQTETNRFLTLLWDVFTLPIISLGRWLSIKFQSINIFIFIMDFIIEAPFKVVLRAIDTFALFIKEKKDEIY